MNVSKKFADTTISYCVAKLPYKIPALVRRAIKKNKVSPAFLILLIQRYNLRLLVNRAYVASYFNPNPKLYTYKDNGKFEHLITNHASDELIEALRGVGLYNRICEPYDIRMFEKRLRSIYEPDRFKLAVKLGYDDKAIDMLSRYGSSIMEVIDNSGLIGSLINRDKTKVIKAIINHPKFDLKKHASMLLRVSDRRNNFEVSRLLREKGYCN